MTEIFLIGLFALVLLDHTLCRRENRDFFREHFTISRDSFAHCLWAIVLGILVFSDDRFRHVAFFIFFTILPIYFYRRYRFIKALGSANRKFILSSDALWVLMLWLYSMTIFALFFKIYSEAFHDGQTTLGELIISVFYSSAAVLFLMYKPAKRFAWGSFWDNVGLNRNHQSTWKIIVLPVMIGLIFAGISSTIILVRDFQPQTPIAEVLEGADSRAVLLLLVLAIFFAPLIEEITFRGYFYYVASQVFGKTPAIIIIASVFGLLHVPQYWGDWAAILMVAILGFVLTFLRAQTGSTIASTVMHYCYNAGATIIPIVVMVTSNPAYFQYHIYQTQLERGEQIELLRTSIQAKPGFAPAYYDLAKIYLEEEGDELESLGLIEKACILEPDNLDFLDIKAEALFRTGAIEESVAVRARMMELEEK